MVVLGSGLQQQIQFICEGSLRCSILLPFPPYLRKTKNKTKSEPTPQSYHPAHLRNTRGVAKPHLRDDIKAGAHGQVEHVKHPVLRCSLLEHRDSGAQHLLKRSESDSAMPGAGMLWLGGTRTVDQTFMGGMTPSSRRLT